MNASIIKTPNHRRHRLLRTALSFAVAYSSSTTVADTTVPSTTGVHGLPTGAVLASPEVPVYPFVEELPSDQKVRRQTPSMALRLLGLTNQKRASNHHQPPMLQPSLAFETISLATINSQPAISTPVSAASSESHVASPAVAQSTQFDTASVVLQASGAGPASAGAGPVQAIVERLSDSSTSGSMSASVAISGDELISSLDQLGLSDSAAPTTQLSSTTNRQPSSLDASNSGFSDSIQLELGSSATSTHSTAVDMNLSDRSEFVASTPAPTATRQPQLIKTKSGRSVQPKATQEIDRATESMSTTEVVNRYEPKGHSPRVGEPMPVQSAMPLLSHPEKGTSSMASTRRDAKPAPLKIRVEGEPLPMLAAPTQLSSAVKPVPSWTGAPQADSYMASGAADKSLRPVERPITGEQVNVKLKDSLTMHAATTIQTLSVEDEQICQLIRTGSRTFSIIGLREGQTRIAVITESPTQSETRIHYVTVGSASSTAQPGDSLAGELAQTIRQIYPQHRIRIVPQGNQLVVSGAVDSEENAKKILSLIRKSTLTPVVDRLETR